MYIDAQQQYSVAQALSATAVSTNAIDHSQNRRLGIGEPLVILITVGVALAGTTPTFQVQLQADTTSAFGAPVVVAQTIAFAPANAAQVGLGGKIVLPIPADVNLTRWSRLNYVLGGTTPTITVTAELTLASAVQNEVYYPAGATVS